MPLTLLLIRLMIWPGRPVRPRVWRSAVVGRKPLAAAITLLRSILLSGVALVLTVMDSMGGSGLVVGAIGGLRRRSEVERTISGAHELTEEGR